MTVTYLYEGSIAGLLSQFKPDGGMVRWLFHAAQVVVDAGVLDPRLQRLRGENHVDAQTALGFILKTSAAVIKPTETVIHCGVEVAEAVNQAPVL